MITMAQSTATAIWKDGIQMYGYVKQRGIIITRRTRLGDASGLVATDEQR